MAPIDSFDVLTSTALSLQEQLSNGRLTSVDTVRTYNAHIEQHNPSLRLLETLLHHAELLDAERKNGTVRGPLHGIPIVIKVVKLNESPHR